MIFERYTIPNWKKILLAESITAILGMSWYCWLVEVGL